MNNDENYNTETPWTAEQMQEACAKKGQMVWQGPKEKVNWWLVIVAFGVLAVGAAVTDYVGTSDLYVYAFAIGAAFALPFWWLMGLAIKGVR